MASSRSLRRCSSLAWFHNVEPAEELEEDDDEEEEEEEEDEEDEEEEGEGMVGNGETEGLRVYLNSRMKEPRMTPSSLIGQIIHGHWQLV